MRKKWEYKVDELYKDNNHNDFKNLNKQGKLGWELVSITQTKLELKNGQGIDVEASFFTAFFKREIID